LNESKSQTANQLRSLRRLRAVVWTGLSANRIAVALALLLAGSRTVLADRGTDNRAPEVPSQIAVESGNKVHFHGFALGVQIYTWAGASWGTAVPSATLFDADGNAVATHFAGPTWKSNSGSLVVGILAKPPLIVDTNAIPWLLLSAAHTEGPGIFADTSFIHRVNTAGGKAPLTNGTFIGQVAEMPYTADYFFYRNTDNNNN
jgi:Protein of unknown function (DUF3455)